MKQHSHGQQSTKIGIYTEGSSFGENGHLEKYLLKNEERTKVLLS